MRFVPKEAGLHFLHAKLDGVHVPGSPFKIKVGGEAAGARRRIDGHVRLSGRGLERIHVGQRTAFVIDTSEVGAGTLSVTVDGPSKVGGRAASKLPCEIMTKLFHDFERQLCFDGLSFSTFRIVF